MKLVQCGVSGKKWTKGGKIAGCRHILTGPSIHEIKVVVVVVAVVVVASGHSREVEKVSAMGNGQLRK